MGARRGAEWPPRIGRRHVLLGLGGGAVAVFTLPACSGSSSPSSSASSASSSSVAASPVPGNELAWDRVNLGFVSAYVLVRGGQAAVVDTGVSGSADAIGTVLDQAGPGWAGVRHVVLTHKHPDHVGSVGEVLTRATTATGYIGQGDLAAVTAPRPLTPLADGADVFGLTVLATPGHTAGHISVFDSGSGVLLAGDALNNVSGLAGSDPQFTENATAAKASVAKLSGLPVRTILFGHGEPLTTDAAAALTRLASG